MEFIIFSYALRTTQPGLDFVNYESILLSCVVTALIKYLRSEANLICFHTLSTTYEVSSLSFYC
jgi:hypothetical protein